jgi:nitrogen fixation NifU-like protein
MASDLDRMAEELQKQANADYSEAVIDHAQNPRNVGSMSDADGHASVIGPCGDRMEMWLKIRNGKVINATFWTDGCGTTIACGSLTTQLASGKTVGEALAINPDVIVENLGGLPEDSIHCAGLASSTLKKAIIDYMDLQREPWKRVYQKR